MESQQVDLKEISKRFEASSAAMLLIADEASKAEAKGLKEPKKRLDLINESRKDMPLLLKTIDSVRSHLETNEMVCFAISETLETYCSEDLNEFKEQILGIARNIKANAEWLKKCLN